jgi:hypothetical protein
MPDPAVARPAIAQANLDVNGVLVRAQVAAPTMREAIDLLQYRLRDRLEHLKEHWEARRGGRPVTAAPEAGEWRHISVPTHRPDYFPRPMEEREVVRRKTFALAEESLDEAIFELESMDYDFHLFTDVDTGQDSVVYRAGPTGYRLAGVRPPGGERVSATPVTLSEQRAPMLSVSEAIKRLELAGLPFVFFVDSGTGRAAVLYHRYDGHYGVITPAAV